MSDSRARSSPLRWIVPSFGSILGLTALANALFFRRARLFATDGDVGRHIRVGRTILDSEAIPRVDLFSHTRGGEPFVPYEWLSEAATALAHQAWGLAGVAVLSALLYLVAVIGIYRAADELGAPRLLALPVAVLGLLLQSVHLLPRPHLFTTAFAAIFIIVLLRFARTGRAWALAPLSPLMLVWANSHGGFLIGFILLVAFVAGALLRSPEFASGGAAVRPLVTALLICVIASLINPAGVELWRHTTGYLGIDFLVAATQEYKSVDFHQAYGKLFFVALFAGPALWMTGRVRVSWLGAGLFLFFAAAALHSVRNIPLFTVATLPWLTVWMEDVIRAGDAKGPRVLGRMRELGATDRLLRPGLSTLAGLGLLWYALGPASQTYRFDPGVFPVEAVAEFDRIDTTGRLFNQMKYGGYLLYARPDVPVFIDGQTDFYGEKLSRDYLTALEAGSGWREVLEGYEIDWTLTGRREPLNQLLALDPAWELTYEDSVAIVYRKRSGR
jgi:hypothetical protein